jgi:hypothetical protein
VVVQDLVVFYLVTKKLGLLGDYCADIRPMVPPLITYCTYYLDNCQDLPFEDIYSNWFVIIGFNLFNKNSGVAREVDLIMKLFQSNKIFPKLVFLQLVLSFQY